MDLSSLASLGYEGTVNREWTRCVNRTECVAEMDDEQPCLQDLLGKEQRTDRNSIARLVQQVAEYQIYSDSGMFVRKQGPALTGIDKRMKSTVMA